MQPEAEFKYVTVRVSLSVRLSSVMQPRSVCLSVCLYVPGSPNRRRHMTELP